MSRKRTFRNESNLVPGKAALPNLERLRSSLVTSPAAAPGEDWKPRRIRRAQRARSAMLALGAVLVVVGTIMFAGRGAPLSLFTLAPVQPPSPDHGLPAAAGEKLWALAGHEAEAFQGLLGIPVDDLRRQEGQARRLERLLSERAHPGLR
jgi:hypothetical protein